jgi:hypothetical protein
MLNARTVAASYEGSPYLAEAGAPGYPRLRSKPIFSNMKLVDSIRIKQRPPPRDRSKDNLTPMQKKLMNIFQKQPARKSNQDLEHLDFVSKSGPAKFQTQWQARANAKSFQPSFRFRT